jgi:DNA/RNA endonuclease YhcR with UshA esterase domain
MKNYTYFVFGALLILLSNQLQAHHGDAGRFEEEVITLSGTVVVLQLKNPHSIIIVDVENENGVVERWQAEVGSVSQLTNNFGWNRNTIQPGDKITVTGRQVKSGAPYINLSEQARIVVTNTCEEIYHSSSAFRGAPPDTPIPDCPN